MRSRVRWWRVALALLAVTGTGGVGADEGDAQLVARVRKFFDSGTTHYNLTEYREALADFTEAYRLRHDPVFLFNIAQCHRQLGDPERAAQFYRNYLREARNPPNRVEVERFIADADTAIAAKRAARPPTAVQAPQLPAATPSALPEASSAPSPGPLPPLPGSSPAAVPIKAASSPAASAAVAPVAPRSRTWLWVTLGVAAAVVAGGAIGLGVGLSRGGDEPTTKLGTL